ncbi:hypothetical protein Dimus_033346 [Dionaea muscipula]
MEPCSGTGFLFSKFGVVKDVYIPRKKNKGGKRFGFGFVRYDCSVAAEVAIQKTNGLWIQDKELKVKIADFEGNQGRKLAGNGRSTVSGPAGGGLPSHS